MRPFSLLALEAFRIAGARSPRSRRGIVAKEGGPRHLRRTLVRAAVLVSLTTVLLLALATPVIASIG